MTIVSKSGLYASMAISISHTIYPFKMATTDFVVRAVNAMEEQDVLIADEPRGLQVVDEDPDPILFLGA